MVVYRTAVHRTGEAGPVPAARPTHLLAYRDAAGRPQLMDLTPAAAALLVEAQGRSIREAAQGLGLSDLPLTLLEELRIRGAIAGFLPA